MVATTPAFAQSDQEARVAALEQALAEIKAGIAQGQDMSARIQTLEDELASLKGDIAIKENDRVEAISAGPAAVIPAGMQGAPNPLQDDKRFLTGDALLDESFPRSLPLPGTGVRLAIGGYAKADFIQDFDYVGDRYEFELGSIPTGNQPEAAFDGRSTFLAKESRINFDFRSEAHSRRTGRDYPLQAFLELDFFDDRESFSLQPRLRHAYGVFGRLLVGQTWTTSGDLQAIPGTIDFSGGDALYGSRVTQIRFEDKLGENATWAIAIEDTRSSIGNPLGLGGADRASLPSLAGRMRWQMADGSHVQVGADLFQLDWQGGNVGPSDKGTGYALNLTGRMLVGGADRNAIVAGGSVGKGSSHRVTPLGWDGGNDAVITPGGLEMLSHWQAYVGYSHYWNDYLNSTFSTAWAGLDNAAAQPGGAISNAGSAHANLIWFPYPLVSTGLELMWGKRENKDGSDGDAIRLQYMVKYKFN